MDELFGSAATLGEDELPEGIELLVDNTWSGRLVVLLNPLELHRLLDEEGGLRDCT